MIDWLVVVVCGYPGDVVFLASMTVAATVDAIAAVVVVVARNPDKTGRCHRRHPVDNSSAVVGVVVRTFGMLQVVVLAVMAVVWVGCCCWYSVYHPRTHE